MSTNASTENRRSSTSTKTSEEEATHRMNVRRASVQMTPEIRHNNEGNTTTVDGGCNVSSSDDSSDVCLGDSYFPLEEGKDSIGIRINSIA